MARFEQVKQEKKEEVIQVDSDEETDSDYETDYEDLVDGKGESVRDAFGHGLVKVCGDEDLEDDNAQREMDELRLINSGPLVSSTDPPGSTSSMTNTVAKNDKQPLVRQEKTTLAPEAKQRQPPTIQKSKSSAPPVTVDDSSTEDEPDPTSVQMVRNDVSRSTASATDCPVCSLSNEPGAATCLACAHVLDKCKIRGSWDCPGEDCRKSGYVNAGDCGVCGICGVGKPAGDDK